MTWSINKSTLYFTNLLFLTIIGAYVLGYGLLGLTSRVDWRYLFYGGTYVVFYGLPVMYVFSFMYTYFFLKIFQEFNKPGRGVVISCLLTSIVLMAICGLIYYLLFLGDYANSILPIGATEKTYSFWQAYASEIRAFVHFIVASIVVSFLVVWYGRVE